MLWINLIMDTFGALALATEPPHESLLKRKPHGRNDYIISPVMMKHILGQSVYQCIVILIFVFAGEHFLFDVIGKRQLSGRSGYRIIPGRAIDGFTFSIYEDYSVHYTYNFNVFVMIQLCNFINCRCIHDELNVFAGIFKNKYFVVIVFGIFLLQVIFLTFAGLAIKTVWLGLDPISWLFCIAFGLIGILWGFILKLIPLEKILPGGGNKEITIDELNKMSTMNLKKKHDSNFYRN